MKSGALQAIFYTLIGSLVIFTFVKNNISEKIPFSLRFLSNKTTEEITYEMCSNSSDDLIDFYQKTGPNYSFEPPSSSDTINNILKNYINSKSAPTLGEEEAKEYFSKSSGYIFILVLIILLIILWIPYTVCICCKCCKCIPKFCLNCPNIMIIGAIILCGLILIDCFIGYSENSSILNGIYGLGCSVLKIEQHLINGDDYKSEKPYWAGINEIVNKLDETKNEISSLQDKTNEVKSQLNDIEPLFADFVQNLTIEYDTRKGKKLKNPTPDEDEFVPEYLSEYGPHTDENKALWFINEELSGFKTESFDTINTIIGTIDIAEKAKEISRNIEEIKNNTNKYVNDIDKTIGEQISKYDESFDQIDSFSRVTMNTLFSINLVLGLGVGASLILLLCCKCGNLILCISWFFLYALMILSFLLGATFGLIGSFFQDVSGGASYILNNLKEVNIEQEYKDIIETCLHGNGDLAQSNLIDINFDSSIIDNIYNLENNITAGINEIEKYKFKSIETNEEKYKKIKSKPKDILTELNLALSEIQNYVDASGSSTYVSSDTPINDEWEINKQDCKYNYILPKSNVRNLVEETGNCLVITEWSLEKIQERYQNIKSNKDEVVIINIVEKYYKSINEFMDSHNNLMDDIIKQNQQFNSSFISIGKEEIHVLENIKGIIKPFREAFEEIVGDGSIFEILNCQFLKRDINKVLEQFYDGFGSTFKVTSTLLIMISIYELAMTLVILIIVTAVKESKKVDSKDINYSKDKDEGL
jgi:hypothetical protein